MKMYTLPDLTYSYSALEPWISGKIMELHHRKHHKAYVDEANRCSMRLVEKRVREDFEGIASLERKLTFNVSGHILHSIFWKNLTPDAEKKPEGELMDVLERDFHSFEMFRTQMINSALEIQGSGWVALVYEPYSERTTMLSIADHQNKTIQGSVPLMVLDVWEHAYYLQYQNKRADYVGAIWSVWNWNDVAKRLKEAQSAGKN